MLQNDILFLLKSNISVIIPDLGAIMTKPGTEELVFNEFLKFNDGLLINHIAAVKEITKIEAAKIVKKFSNNIIKDLAKNQEYDLEELGVLYIDDNEKIQLKSTTKIDSINKVSQNIEIKENINETQKSNTPYNNPKPSLLENKLVENQNSATLKEKAPMFDNASHSKNENGNDSSHNDMYDYYERKPIWKIILISFIVIALIGAAGYYIFKKNPHLFSKHETFESMADTNTIAQPKEEQKNEAVSAYENTEVSDKTSSGKKYHIIAGAFVVEKNATAFMQELQKKGYDPEIVLKRNNYSFISIFSYPSFKEANTKIKTFDNTGMPVWIMKMR